jgi:hypothetical protein
MKILPPPSGRASKTPFSRISLPPELVEIAMLSAFGWSVCILVAVYFAPVGSSYPGTEIATLAPAILPAGDARPPALYRGSVAR